MVSADSRSLPDFRRERALMRGRSGPVCGIDEAGMGPWAGPVVAAAVILDPRRIPEGLDDSKRLPRARREALYESIMASAIATVAVADVARIDADNILCAALWAMTEAVRDLSEPPAAALVDGNRRPELGCETHMLVGGDGLSLSIAAASIVAKVTRDRIMCELARDHGLYGWETNMGYGTPAHAAALARHGPTPHHRRSFRPVREVLSLD